jgi:hypothetical protein
MALPPVALRYRKSVRYLAYAFFGFMFILPTYMIFFSGAVQIGTLLYVNYAVMSLILALGLVFVHKRMKDPRPVLVFSSEGLQMPRRKNRFIPWGEVTEWKIRTHKSNHRLVVRTREGRTGIDVTWLDRDIAGIKALMQTYIRQPGPGGFQR